MNQIRNYIYSLDLNIYEFPFHHWIVTSRGRENDPKSHHRIISTISSVINWPHTHPRGTTTRIVTRRGQTRRRGGGVCPIARTRNCPIRQSQPNSRPIRQDNIVPWLNRGGRRLYRFELRGFNVNSTQPPFLIASHRQML